MKLVVLHKDYMISGVMSDRERTGSMSIQELLQIHLRFFLFHAKQAQAYDFPATKTLLVFSFTA